MALQMNESDYNIQFTDDEDERGQNKVPKDVTKLLMLTEKDREMLQDGRMQEPERAVLNTLSMKYEPMQFGINFTSSDDMFCFENRHYHDTWDHLPP